MNFSSLSGKVRDEQLEERSKVLSKVIYYYHKILEEERGSYIPGCRLTKMISLKRLRI